MSSMFCKLCRTVNHFAKPKTILILLSFKMVTKTMSSLVLGPPFNKISKTSLNKYSEFFHNALMFCVLCLLFQPGFP